MIQVLFLTSPIIWLLFWIPQAAGCYRVMEKMRLRKWMGLIPFLAEWELSGKLFRRMRSFYRAFAIAAVLALAAWYLDASVGVGRVYMIIAHITFGIFLIRLFRRMGKAFGKGRFFTLGLILLPAVFLPILGFGVAEYQGYPMKPLKERSGLSRALHKTALVVISGVELVVLVACVGYFTIKTEPPVTLVKWMMEDTYEKTKDIRGNGEVVTREEMMGEDVSQVNAIKPSREKFFSDHTGDRNAVVLVYVVGSNLENQLGLASVNIRQMKEATKQGEGLTFVMEAGGSKRWFTEEIENRSYGRYEIEGGQISKVEELPDDTCLSEGKTLKRFLKWAGKKYPSDRYMLVLWDHGGGLAYGYGQDSLNDRPDSGQMNTIRTSEVVSAIRDSKLKFDVIGFDACLMQDVEIASAMEPYTDYYLASEETEGGEGWFYTSPFGKLAKDPGVSTEEFLVDLLSCYDQLNTIVKDEAGKPDTKATLSVVDTTLAAPAYKKFCRFLKEATATIKDDPGAYASLAVAGSNAYAFEDDLQIDLIDFLTLLNKADYKNRFADDARMEDMVKALRACVLYRNKDSAEGINGLAFAFPYKAIGHYSNTHDQLKALSMKAERKLFDEVFSIMAVQKKKAEKDGSTGDAADYDDKDYTKEKWYVKGFEHYDGTDRLVDIPVEETSEGYQVKLPEKTWGIIADCQTMVYQKVGKKGRLRYLGMDHIGGEDSLGHPTIGMDDQWLHIEGRLVCFLGESVRETKKGEIYSGKVPALLNEEDRVNLIVEWDPVMQKGESSQAHVVGYENAEKQEGVFSFLDTKGTLSLKAGDSIRFLFDIYDAEGNLVKSSLEGESIRISDQSRLKVEDARMAPCVIVFNGALTDVYQRIMTTEQIEMRVGE